MTLVTSKANPIWHFRRNTQGPRRIVHVPRRFASRDWSGVESVVLELAKQQVNTGMDPVIISTLALSEMRHEIISGIRVHRHPHSYLCFGSGDQEMESADQTSDNLLSIPVFQSLMQEPEVRLFHSQTPGRLGGEVLNAARMRGRPFVTTVHQGPDFSVLSGSRKQLEDADMAIFVDKSQADRAAATLGHERIAHLPHGVDCARFAAGDGASVRAKHGIPQGACVIGGFGRIDADKIQLLLEAFARVSARRSGMHVIFTAPETEIEEIARLTTFITERGLTGQAHVLPEFQSRDLALVDALHACDVLVQFSSSDAAESDILDAWSTGRPMIAAHGIGSETPIRDGETGLLFEPGSSNAADKLAAHIEFLVGDEARRHDLGNKGRNEALARDWSRIGTQLEDIYQLAERNHQSARLQGRKAA